MSKILVIEDEQSIRAELLDVLRLEGFEAVGAENGLVGLRQAREHLPDLIVCDIIMPEMDGYEVYQEIRQDGELATIPFIFLTAKTQYTEIRQGMEMGVDDYLTKPFTNEQLLQAIKTRLEKRRTQETHRLRNFAHRLVAMQDNERRQFARTLQDEVAPFLNSLELTVLMSQRLPPETLPTTVDDIHDLIQQTSDKVNNHILNFWPPVLDHLGLLSALLWYFGRYTDQTQVKVDFQHNSLETVSSNKIKIAVYRIIQEALANVAVHANVKTVMIRAWVEDDALNFQIVDRGIGFHLEQVMAKGNSIGLTSMVERAVSLHGHLRIFSEPGTGTQIIAQIPLNGANSKSNTEKIVPDTTRMLEWGGSAGWEKTTILPPSPEAPAEKIKIVVASGQDVVRQRLRQLLDIEPDLLVVGEVGQSEQLVTMAERLNPAALVLDMAGQGRLKILASMTQRMPELPILALAESTAVVYVVEVLRYGAGGYLLKNNDSVNLAHAIKEIVAGRLYLSPTLSQVALEAYVNAKKAVRHENLDAYNTLTRREREILTYVVQGLTDGEVAEELYISARTVETHRANLMRKLGVRNKTELVRYVLRKGIAPLDER